MSKILFFVLYQHGLSLRNELKNRIEEPKVLSKANLLFFILPVNMSFLKIIKSTLIYYFFNCNCLIISVSGN